MKKLILELILITLILVGSGVCFATNSKTSRPSAENLMRAIDVGDYSTYKKLLHKHKLDLNFQDESGMTPLMSAALGGQIIILHEILARKVDLERKNSKGDTALAIAVSNDQFKAAQVLIESGANVDLVVAGETGDTLLIRAAQNDAATTELILKKNKSLVNKVNKLGETALMKAIEFGNLDSIKILLTAGADLYLKNKAGQNAADLAASSGNKAIKNLFKK